MNSPTLDEGRGRRIGHYLALIREEVATFPMFPLGSSGGAVDDDHWETVGRLLSALKYMRSIAVSASAQAQAEADVSSAPTRTGGSDSVMEQPVGVVEGSTSNAASQTKSEEIPAEVQAESFEEASSPEAAIAPAQPAPTRTRAFSADDLPVFPSPATEAPANQTISPQNSESTDILASSTSDEAAKTMASAPEQPSVIRASVVAGSAEPKPSADPVPTAQSVTPVPKVPNMPRVESRRQVLPNTMVGKEYSVSVVLSDTPVLAVRDLQDLSNGQIESLGLKLDLETMTLSGVPSADGDFDLVLAATVEGPAAGQERRVEWKGVLTVNPDPKSLWKNIPSDDKAPYWKEDAWCEQITTEGGERFIVAASKRGRSHAHNGTFRDDDFAITHLSQFGWNILAVADGAGSAAVSREGSRIAVNSVTTTLKELLPKTFEHRLDELAAGVKAKDPQAERDVRTALYQTLVTAAYQACKEIVHIAEGAGRPAKEFSTTLIIVVHIETAAGHLVAGFSIGDGGAALLDVESGSVFTLTRADSGEFAGQTRFLSPSEFEKSEENFQRLRFTVVEKFTALIAMTDGITDPKFPTDAAFEDRETWLKFWTEDLDPAAGISTRSQDAKGRLLEWLDFWSPGNHDDRTIAILS